MKSFIAALRSLTLPFGAVSGPRIVLNGVLGRIEVYSNTGSLLFTLDDDGFLIYDADGDLRLKLASTTDFSSIVFRDTAGLNPAIITYQTGSDYRSLTLQGPQTVKEFGRLFNISPTNTTKNPLLQWDTGILTSDVAQPIVDLTGFTRGDARAAVVAVEDIKRASNNGGANAPTLERSYPRGTVTAPAKRTSNLTFSDAAVTQIVALAAATLISGRRYKLSFSWEGVTWATSNTAGIDAVRLRDGTTRIQEVALVNDGGTGREGGSMFVTLDCPADITAGSHTFDAAITRASGTGVHTLQTATDYPSTLVLEDIGDNT